MESETEFIRSSTADDCRDVYALICNMEEKELPYAAFERIFQQQLKDADYACLVYVSDGKVKGCINLRMEYQLHHAERICEIMELSVSPECRSRGIGKQLFDEACHHARQEGCTQIEVCCNRLRTRTHRFYEARGMHNFHYKFSLNFALPQDSENRLGR